MTDLWLVRCWEHPPCRDGFWRTYSFRREDRAREMFEEHHSEGHEVAIWLEPVGGPKIPPTLRRKWRRG